MLSPKDAGLYNEENNKRAVRDGLMSIFPLQASGKTLSIEDVEFSDPKLNPDDWRDVYKAISSGKSISSEVRPTFVLKDEAGNVTKSKLKIGELPLLTNLDTFVVNGSQYNLPTQFRLKSGGYARETAAGTPEIFINAKGKRSLRLFVDENKKLLKAKIGQGSVPLTPLLKAMGATEDEIESILGKELSEINMDVNDDMIINKTYKALLGKNADKSQDASKAIKDYLSSAELDPEVNKITLGTGHSTISKDMLLDATDQLIKLTKKEIDPINRESLQFKSVHGVDDILQERLSNKRNLGLSKYNMMRKMTGSDDISKIIDKNKFTKDLEQAFTTSKLSRFSSQSNPTAILNTPFMTTLLGEGGVHNPDAVPEDAKRLQASHMGFLDISHTPESMKAGITLTMAINTKKDGSQIKTKVINIRTNQPEWLSPEDINSTPLAFANQFTLKGSKWRPAGRNVQVIVGDEHKTLPYTSVKYMLPQGQDMFDLASNTIPFLQTDQGNRGMTSAKMSEQAVSLVNPEKPLVEPIIDGISVLDDIGSRFSVRANTSGIVDKILDDSIIIDSGGNKVEHPIPRNFPLNNKSILDSNVRVREGERVKKGDLLADSNFTRDGKYSYGVNLTTAYMPYLGFNHEDAALISQSAADKLKSLHMHKISIPIGDTTITDLKKFQAYNPFAFKKEDAKKYDDDGTIRIGQTLHPHDILAATMSENVLTGVDNIIAKLRKSAVKPMKDNSLLWKESVPGIVTDKVVHKDRIDLFVKTEEPFEVGDKLSGRHGNKHIVSKIIPDDMMPMTEHGEKIDIIMEPHGVPSRINPGQILEAAAGRLASLTGKPFQVENFSGKDYRKIIADELDKANKAMGIKVKDVNHPDKLTIFDPSTGMKINNIGIGKAYITKLNHQVGHKLSARGIKEPYTQDHQPTRGGGVGGQSIDKLTANALLAYNTRDLLQDMFSIKNNRNNEYWRAIIHKELPPAPKESYELKKFDALLKSMGVNTVAKGTSLKLSPFTDRQILDMSAGEIPNPDKSFFGKGVNLTPIKTGLFGEVAGGMSGTEFNHISIDEPFISPAYRDAVKSLLGITNKELDEMEKL